MYRKRGLLSVLAIVFVLLVGSASFGQSLSDIRHNIKAKGQKWIAGDTSISMLPDNEKKRRLGLIRQAANGKEKIVQLQEPETGLAPSVDWTNFTTPVRNQGSCGSCWAFAVTGALEANILIRENMPLGEDNRAEQILVSCSGAGSCGGGSVGSASIYVQSVGLPPESDFPYTATDNTCSNAEPGWQDNTSKVGSWSYVNTTPANLTAIKNALSTYGPLVTTMDVYYDFYSYKGGIYEYSTGSLQGGHAVLIVGYTDDPSRPDGGYFKVKNSWGTGWGSGGYFLIGYSQLNKPVYFGEWTLAYTAPALVSPPAAPGGLTASAVSSSRIDLAWTDNSNDEEGFRIERCTGSGCSNFSQLATVGIGVTSYSNTGLTGGASYSYRVRAYNNGGNSAYSGAATATTPAVQPPAAPTGLTPTSASTSQINLTWTDNSSNEAGFKIERCTGSGCTGFAQIATVGAGVRSYSNTGLSANTTYGYRVRAYNADANSAYSGEASAKTLCSCTISPTSKSFPASGGTLSVTVTAAAGCNWTVNESLSWVESVSAASGTGNGSYTYRVATNANRARRAGTINIGGKTHTITQAKK